MLNAKLAPEGDGTRVELEYQIFSPNGTGFVEAAIKKNRLSTKERLQLVRTMQPTV